MEQQPGSDFSLEDLALLLFGKEHLAEIVAAKQLLHRCVAVG